MLHPFALNILLGPDAHLTLTGGQTGGGLLRLEGGSRLLERPLGGEEGTAWARPSGEAERD